MRWEVHRVDPRLLAAARGQLGDAWLHLVQEPRPQEGRPEPLIGPIATGDKVVALKSTLDRYRDFWPKLIGLEMEAGGVAGAAFQAAMQPGFFMVRGVSDLADEAKGTAAVESWRKYACDVAAAYTVALLQSGPVLPAAGPR